MGFMKLSGGHEFFYEKHFKVSAFFNRYENGISFSFVKMFQGKPKSKSASILSFLFHDMELLQKITSIFGKKVSFHDLNTEKMEFLSQIEDKTPVEILLDNHFVSLRVYSFYAFKEV
jgi:hypothetical protein